VVFNAAVLVVFLSCSCCRWMDGMWNLIGPCKLDTRHSARVVFRYPFRFAHGPLPGNEVTCGGLRRVRRRGERKGNPCAHTYPLFIAAIVETVWLVCSLTVFALAHKVRRFCICFVLLYLFSASSLSLNPTQ